MDSTEKHSGSSNGKTVSPDTHDDLEKLLDYIGGHGPFQFFVWTVGFGTKACVAGVFLFMSFAGATPDFWCASASGGNGSEGMKEVEMWKSVNGTENSLFKACSVNETSCSSFVFEDSMTTIVNEVSERVAAV